MMDTDTEGFEISRVISKTDFLNHLPVNIVTGISREMRLPFKFEPHDHYLPVKAVVEKPVESFYHVKEVFEKPVDPEHFEKAL